VYEGEGKFKRGPSSKSSKIQERERGKLTGGGGLGLSSSRVSRGGKGERGGRGEGVILEKSLGLDRGFNNSDGGAGELALKKKTRGGNFIAMK